MTKDRNSPGLADSGRIIRTVTTINFILFGIFVIPATHRWADYVFMALRPVHLEDTLGHSLQVWIVGSTVLITALLGRMAWRNRRAAPQFVQRSLRTETVLVLAWWLVALGVCAYGFMLGMGG